MKLAYAVLAAGRGTRMGQLTKNRNKCMLKFEGKPILAHIIDTLIFVGASEIYITVNYCKEEMIDYLTHEYKDIKFNFIEESLEGTGKSIDTLRSINADYIFIMMGDQIFDTKKIFDFIQHFKLNPANYILSREVDNPQKYGVLEVQGDRVLEIIEKPEHPTSNLINLGVYIFHKSIFDFTKNLKKSIRGEYEITDAIQKSIMAENIFRHFSYNNVYLDFTKPEDLKQKRILK